jgi:hypothetical protein
VVRHTAQGRNRPIARVGDDMGGEI